MKVLGIRLGAPGPSLLGTGDVLCSIVAQETPAAGRLICAFQESQRLTGVNKMFTEDTIQLLQGSCCGSDECRINVLSGFLFWLLH